MTESDLPQVEHRWPCTKVYWGLTVTEQHKVHVSHRLSGVQKPANHLDERLDDHNKASYGVE